MKKILTLLFILFLIALRTSAQERWIENPVPMHIGNTYQYLHVYEDSRDHYLRYSTSKRSIWRDTLVDGKTYYDHPHISGWSRYDEADHKLYRYFEGGEKVLMDFNLEAGEKFNHYVSGNDFYEAEILRGTVTLFGEVRKYAGYRYIIIFNASDYIIYEEKYVENIGEYDNYLAALIYDKDGNPQVYDRNRYPEISFEPVNVTDKDYFNLKANIDHSYTRIFIHEFFNYSEVCFIEDAVMEYHYSNGSSVINADSVHGERREWTTEFQFRCDLDTNLMKSGYDFHYRIKATDKLLYPKTAWLPETGYERLRYDPSISVKHNFFPLAVGNKWLFNVNRDDWYGDRFENEVQLFEVTDEKITGGKKYYYVSGLNRWCRYDTLSRSVYILDDETEHLFIYLDGYPDELYNSYNLVSHDYRDVHFQKGNTKVFGSSRFYAGMSVPSFYNPETYTFADNIGPVKLHKTYGSDSFSFLYEDREIVQFFVLTEEDTLFGSHEYYPVMVGNKPETEVKNDTLCVTFEMSHELSKHSDEGYQPNPFTFIDTVFMEAEFVKEGEETVKDTLPGVIFPYTGKNIDKEKYVITDEDYGVYSANGYTCSFRIHAVDKGFVPHSVVYPETGRYRLDESGGLIVVGLEDIEIPGQYKLTANYPNPFNPATKFDYHLPERSEVNIRVYDMLGREVTTLEEVVKDAGIYTAGFNGAEYSSGIYILRFTAKGVSGKTFNESIKMMLLK